ncbi:MAG: hypothetical protein AB2813_02265 [Candidatus Sedimenticola endophacoides]
MADTEQLNNGRLLLIDQDRSRIDYLEHILRFLDYSVDVAGDPVELKQRLDLPKRPRYLAVLIGSGFEADPLEEMIGALRGSPDGVALFRVVDDDDNISGGRDPRWLSRYPGAADPL